MSVHRGVCVITTVTMTQPAAESTQLPLESQASHCLPRFCSVSTGRDLCCKSLEHPHTTEYAHTNTKLLVKMHSKSPNIYFHWAIAYLHTHTHTHSLTPSKTPEKENACQQLGVIDLPGYLSCRWEGLLVFYKMKRKKKRKKDFSFNDWKHCYLSLSLLCPFWWWW